MDDKIHDLIIVGSGPAGLTASIYASRANLTPIVLAGIELGGQLMKTTEVENFPGFPEGIDGPTLMMNMVKQAEKFGSVIKYETVIEVSLDAPIKIIKTDSGEYKCRSIIIATGSQPRKLGIKGEDEFYGKGVSVCATCDAFFYKNKVVAVIGGGDSAMEEASFLTRFASKVYLIHRRDSFRASPIMIERVLTNPKIEVLYNSEVKEVIGTTGVVTALSLYNNKEDKVYEVSLDGMFLAIGHIPVTGFLKNTGINLDSEGYVETLREVITNLDGVFIAGDIHDKEWRQAITASGDGCRAALASQRWLELNKP